MAKNKKKQKTKQGGAKGKAPVFVIEKDGLAYFKDKALKMVCRPSKMAINQKYPGYMFQYDYLENLTWFKRYVMLFQANGGAIRFVGMTEAEFFELGGEKIEAENFEEVDASEIKRKASGLTGLFGK